MGFSPCLRIWSESSFEGYGLQPWWHQPGKSGFTGHRKTDVLYQGHDFKGCGKTNVLYQGTTLQAGEKLMFCIRARLPRHAGTG
jgi:hypothetical protein